MAPEAMEVIIGVDVCKERLDLFEYHSERAYSISNDAAAIKAWLDGFAVRLKLAVEPTNHHHPGLDVRVNQFGRWQGRCKLIKKGDGEVRRLLYTAAMQGRRRAQWAPYYLRLRERGMSSTATLVALSRKLARVSSALLRTDGRFVPAVPTLDALDRTHAQMIGALSQLAALMTHLRDNGVDDTARRNAADICAFFADHARQHHADEERRQQDHGWLEEDWIELAPQLQAVAQGYSWYEIDELSRAVSVFVNLDHEHISLEDSLIYPAARKSEAAAAA